MASYYLVESYEYAVDHGGRSSEGVVGDKLSPLIREKIYLHVLPLGDAEIKRLVPRVDEDGNKQHGRLTLPGEESFWIAIDGEIAWPRVHAPRLVSCCRDDGSGPRPVPLDPGAIERLTAAGLSGVSSS